MVAEYLVFERAQVTAAHQAKVGNVLFVRTPVHEAGLLAVQLGQRNAADVLLFRHTMVKSRVAGAKDGAKDAVAGVAFSFADGAQPNAAAVRAGLSSESDGIFSFPVHLGSTSFPVARVLAGRALFVLTLRSKKKESTKIYRQFIDCFYIFTCCL